MSGTPFDEKGAGMVARPFLFWGGVPDRFLETVGLKHSIRISSVHDAINSADR
jgi:hypothetical protein